jgi:hypothetical protein
MTLVEKFLFIILRDFPKFHLGNIMKVALEVGKPTRLRIKLFVQLLNTICNDIEYVVK